MRFCRDLVALRGDFIGIQLNFESGLLLENISSDLKGV